MKQIWKYPLEVTDLQEIYAPADAQFISVLVQREQIYLYAIVSPDKEEREKFGVRIVGTGHPLMADAGDDHTWRFIGTVGMFGGKLVWHVFVEK